MNFRELLEFIKFRQLYVETVTDLPMAKVSMASNVHFGLTAAFLKTGPLFTSNVRFSRLHRQAPK